jgi:hypothetical protein
MRTRVLGLALLAGACGAAPPPPVTATTARPDEPTERACFSGTTDNGVCEIFSAALEPLGALAAHCRQAHGQWLVECPTEGRVGTCAGEGRRAVYYGPSIGPTEARRACEGEGHVFTP